MPAALTLPLSQALKERAIQVCHTKIAQKAHKIVKMLETEG
jgi:hypothetical protein